MSENTATETTTTPVVTEMAAREAARVALTDQLTAEIAAIVAEPSDDLRALQAEFLVDRLARRLSWAEADAALYRRERDQAEAAVTRWIGHACDAAKASTSYLAATATRPQRRTTSDAAAGFIASLWFTLALVSSGVLAILLASALGLVSTH